MKEILYYTPEGIFDDLLKVQTEYKIIKKPFFYKLNDKEIAEILKTISNILRSDISFKNFLNYIIPYETNKKLQWVLANIYYYTDQENMDLGDAIKESGAFPIFVVSALKSKTSATVRDILQKTEVYYIQRHEFKKKVREQLTPPLITVGFAVVLIIAAVFFLLPMLFNQFKQIFGASLDFAQLPFITQFLLKLSSPLFSFSFLGIIIFIGFIIFSSWRRYSTGNFPSLDFLLIKLPIVKKLMLNSIYYEFFNTLSFYREAGNVIESIYDLKETTTSGIVKNLCNFLEQKLEEGEDLYAAIGEFNYTPLYLKPALQASKIGMSENYMLDYCLTKTKDELDKAYSAFANFMSFFPIIIVAVIVLLIIVGVYLGPMTQLMSAIGGPSGP